MEKKFVPVTAITVILAVVAVVGYLRPVSSEDMPKRILFDNKGGTIVFSHLEHSDSYAESCETCHHESESVGSDPLACGSCHVVAFDKEFKENHMNSGMSDEHCQRCHHEGFDGQDSLACSECHEEKTSELVPPRMSAFHKQCMGCHEEVGSGPYEPEDCNQCHTPG